MVFKKMLHLFNKARRFAREMQDGKAGLIIAANFAVSRSARLESASVDKYLAL